MALPRLTSAAHSLLSAIAEGSRDGSYSGSNADLVGATGFSERSIKRALVDLEAAGLIARTCRGKIRSITLDSGSVPNLSLNRHSVTNLARILVTEPLSSDKFGTHSCHCTNGSEIAATDETATASVAPSRVHADAPGRADGFLLPFGNKNQVSRPDFAGGREELDQAPTDRPKFDLQETPEIRAHRLAAAVAKARDRNFPWAESLPDYAAKWDVPGAVVLAALRITLKRYEGEANLKLVRAIAISLEPEELTRADLVKPSPVREPVPPPAAPPATPEAAAAEEAELRAVIAQIRTGIPASTQAKVAEDLERARAPGPAKPLSPPPARSREEVLRELEARSRAANQ